MQFRITWDRAVCVAHAWAKAMFKTSAIGKLKFANSLLDLQVGSLVLSPTDGLDLV